MKSYKRSAIQAVRCTALLAGLGLAVGFSPPAQAALQAVGPNATFSNGAATGFTFPAWYQDTAGLRLDLCALMNDPFCFSEGLPAANEFPAEMFWWAAEALIAPTDPGAAGVDGLVVLAMEAAFGGAAELVVPGGEVAFARIRIRVSVPTPGTYTVTHPFGSQTYVVPDAVPPAVFDGTNAINETQDIGDLVVPGPTSNFTLALLDGPGGEPGEPAGNISTTGASIGPFLLASATPGGAALPFVTSITPGALFLANPLVPTPITGAVAGGGNFFRITGPGVDVTQNLFSLTGLVSGTQPAKVTLDEADYRVRTGKWALFGTSTTPTQVTTGPAAGVTTHFTNLFGAQEMPPQTSAASGSFSTVFDTAVADSFTYNLTLNVPAGTDMTQAHIHTGAVGVNGPVIFFLCSDLAGAPAGTPLCTEVNGVVAASGTLTAADLQAQTGIADFTAAVAAIQAGTTYVNAHSVAVPTGEIRGQIGRNVISLRAGVDGPAIGAAAVGTTGLWQFNSKGIVAPAALIEAETSDGNTATRALRLR